ncbi:MAG: DMT family transporter [Pseudomonadota bacterium]|jgi:S-adenosylmethionine uptake transporter|nr:DMT family transporter [Alphaproteobacteria bacterium]
MTALTAFSMANVPFFGWFVRKGYLQGVFWALMICVVSSTNDVLMRFLGERLHVVQIISFRFFFSMLTVLPLMLRHEKNLFKTAHPKNHTLRAIVGALALGLCCLSVNIMPLAENTAIMFCEPLFFLPMAYFLLKEKVDKNRWIATLVGFIGLLIIVQPGMESFRVTAFVPMAAAMLFAYLCVMAKQMISTEHTLTLLFYFGLGTSVFAGIFLPFVWVTPTMHELVFLILLGIGANLIQVCLFRAYSSTDASALAPFRYTEFLFAGTFGFLFFGQIPDISIVLGAGIIGLSAFYISYMETKKEAASGN